MSNTTDRYIPDEKEVTAKVIDGEAIIINLLTGVYYSMDGVGAVVWQALELGASVGEIIDALGGRFPDHRNRIETDVIALIDRLIEESMLLPRVEAAGGATTLDTGGAGSAYRSPELIVYRDMAEILALDPPTPGVFDSLLKDPDPSSGNR